MQRVSSTSAWHRRELLKRPSCRRRGPDRVCGVLDVEELPASPDDAVQLLRRLRDHPEPQRRPRGDWSWRRGRRATRRERAGEHECDRAGQHARSKDSPHALITAGTSVSILRATWRPLPGIRRSRPPGPKDRPGLGARNHADHTALRIAEARDPGAWGCPSAPGSYCGSRSSRPDLPAEGLFIERIETNSPPSPARLSRRRSRASLRRAGGPSARPTWPAPREPAKLRRRRYRGLSCFCAEAGPRAASRASPLQCRRGSQADGAAALERGRAKGELRRRAAAVGQAARRSWKGRRLRRPTSECLTD